MNQLAFNAEAMWSALENNPEKTLGQLMLQSHKVLDHLGLATAKINKIVNDFMELGALGAKLTGAGCGGYVVALMKKSKVWEHPLQNTLTVEYV